MTEKRTAQARLGPVEADFFTIGYERLSVEELFGLLKEAGVHCLVDVRDAPWSRVHDYRKGVLEDRIAALGAAQGYHVRYVSMPSLGNPAVNRKSGWSDTESMTFYRQHVAAKTEELDELRGIIGRCKAALMCYEADPGACHRSELAKIVSERYGLSHADLRR